MTKEAAENIARASQNGRTINVAGTSRVVPLVKEAAQSVVEVSHIVRAAKVTEALVAAGVAAQIAVQEILNWSS